LPACLSPVSGFLLQGELVCWLLAVLSQRKPRISLAGLSCVLCLLSSAHLPIRSKALVNACVIGDAGEVFGVLQETVEEFE